MTATDTLGLVGMTIDEKYVVESVVGEGGFGVVYRATHKVWEKPVAIKCFKSLMEVSPAMRDKLLKDFIQEGALLSDLSARSASIVQARDVGTITLPSGAWVPYMVLEWLEGETLEEHAERLGMRAWPLDRAMGLLEPIALALEIAHRRNIAHRDIKPANIFLLRDALDALQAPAGVDVGTLHVKLLDFGIAKVVQTAAEQGFTQTGGQVTSFTPSYGAPEQFSRKNGATGPWTDVYALALILVELLTGRYALDGEDFIQLGMASADPNRRPTPRALGVDYGDAFEQVMTRALAIAPAHRFPTAGEFWDGLRVAVGASPLRRASSGELRSGVTTQPRTAGASVPMFGQAATVAAGMTPVAMPHPTPPTPMQGGEAANGTFTPNVAAPIAVAAAPAKKSFPVAMVVTGVVLFAAAAGAVVVFASRRDNDAPRGTTGAASTTEASGNPAATHASSAPPTPAKPRCPEGMIAIDGGEFYMGADSKDAADDEKPVHNVTLSPFCMDPHEVTVAEYLACSESGKCRPAAKEVDFEDMTEADKKLFSPLCTIREPVAKAKHPINCVDWERAATYCLKNGKRLPSEAEWEYAARGPDGRIYPWGDEAPNETHLNACDAKCAAWAKKNGRKDFPQMFDGDDGFATTAPVMSFPEGRSRYELYDVVGNVWEWTNDWDAPYTADAQVDPKGPPSGEDRIVRGGAWNAAMPSWMRPSKRYQMKPTDKSHLVGFRCAATQSSVAGDKPAKP